MGAHRFFANNFNYLCDMKKKTIREMGRMSVDEFRHSAKIPLVVMLDNVRSLNNIGSLFRTCDAFAVESIALCGISATPPSPEIHKTALGAEDSMAWEYFATSAEAVAHFRQLGYKIACLEQVNGSVELEDFEPEPGCRYVLICGNEVDGVDQAIVDSADVWLEIPQAGTKHSLNVTVSTAIAIWEFFKKLRAKS